MSFLYIFGEHLNDVRKTHRGINTDLTLSLTQFASLLSACVKSRFDLFHLGLDTKKKEHEIIWLIKYRYVCMFICISHFATDDPIMKLFFWLLIPIWYWVSLPFCQKPKEKGKKASIFRHWPSSHTYTYINTIFYPHIPHNHLRSILWLFYRRMFHVLRIFFDTHHNPKRIRVHTAAVEINIEDESKYKGGKALTKTKHNKHTKKLQAKKSKSKVNHQSKNQTESRNYHSWFHIFLSHPYTKPENDC